MSTRLLGAETDCGCFPNRSHGVQTMRTIIFSVAFALVAVAGMLGARVDTSAPGWLSMNHAEASPYRRSVRRTSRRTSRRTAARHDYYRAPYRGAAVAGAAVVTAVAIGTLVATLPPSCSTVIVDGVSYHNCSGTWYRPQGSQYIVVNAP